MANKRLPHCYLIKFGPRQRLQSKLRHTLQSRTVGPPKKRPSKRRKVSASGLFQLVGIQPPIATIETLDPHHRRQSVHLNRLKPCQLWQLVTRTAENRIPEFSRRMTIRAMNRFWKNRFWSIPVAGYHSTHITRVEADTNCTSTNNQHLIFICFASTLQMSTDNQPHLGPQHCPTVKLINNSSCTTAPWFQDQQGEV